MVRNTPHTNTKSTTSPNSFASQSSGCHTVWRYAARRDACWGHRCVECHQRKWMLEILWLNTTEKQQRDLVHVFHLIFFFSLWLSSWISLSFYPSSRSLFTVSWREFRSFVSTFRTPTSSSQKWENGNLEWKWNGNFWTTTEMMYSKGRLQETTNVVSLRWSIRQYCFMLWS